MSISNSMREQIAASSWIRKMFEEGAQLKEEFGAENVFDFTLGNPSVPPPDAFSDVLHEEISSKDDPLLHRYMNNAGFPEARERIAAKVSEEHHATFDASQIIMTCGAAGALNVVLETLLDPGDEVVILAPYFAEYIHYIRHHGGTPVIVQTTEDFRPGPAALKQAITPKTKVIIVNSPNNPTGTVYNDYDYSSIADAIAARPAADKLLFVVSDEPYRQITYDNVQCPSIFPHFQNAVMAYSFSKDLGLAGERIGFIVVGPEAEEKDVLCSGLTVANRTLGFVNAPALMQRVASRLYGMTCDLSSYRRNRDTFHNGLIDAGYDVIKPQGAFYLFPRSPIADEIAFLKLLRERNILAVPGSGFGTPGYFRLAFCVDEEVIARALPGFQSALREMQ